MLCTLHRVSHSLGEKSRRSFPIEWHVAQLYWRLLVVFVARNKTRNNLVFGSNEKERKKPTKIGCTRFQFTINSFKSAVAGFGFRDRNAISCWMRSSRVVSLELVQLDYNFSLKSILRRLHSIGGAIKYRESAMNEIAKIQFMIVDHNLRLLSLPLSADTLIESTLEW